MRLLKFLIKTAEERSKQKPESSLAKFSFHNKIMSMLQDPLLDGIIHDAISEDERKCIVLVMIVLNEEMERKQRQGLLRIS